MKVRKLQKRLIKSENVRLYDGEDFLNTSADRIPAKFLKRRVSTVFGGLYNDMPCVCIQLKEKK